MNKVTLMGRLTRKPELRYSQGADPVAVTRYGLAVKRSYVKSGEPEADFINVVAFGKRGEFSSKYFKKGQMVAVVGRLQVRSYEDQQSGQRKWVTEVIAEEQHFAESRASFESRAGSEQANENKDGTSDNSSSSGYYPIDEDLDDEDLPF